MERRSLEFFRAVVESGSVSGAAAAMSVTQPAVSKQISRLESTLSLKLFHRTSAGMAMTAAGEALYELANDVLIRFDRIESALKMRFAGRPAVRIASPHTTATVLIAPFMVDTNPPIVDLLIANAPEVDEMLDQDADMAISTLRPPPHRHQMVVASLIIRAQGTPQLMRSRFGNESVADLEKLTKDAIIVPRTGVHVVVEEVTAKFARPLAVRGVSTGSVAQALAANGHGFALATEQVSFNLEGLPAYAQGKPVVSPLYASWDAQHYAATELRRLAHNFRHWMSVTPPWASAMGNSAP
jgi:DNA-binding transcriptional LysR family regulator